MEIPASADERTLLVGYLDRYRAAMIRKLQGLTLAQATRRLVPSATTLLGMVKHLALVEQHWFRTALHNEAFPVQYDGENPDDSFRVEPGETVESVVALYVEAIAGSKRAIDGVSLDAVATWDRPERPSLRRILIHMIEETARHVGQADILREQTDGATDD